ncbi:MAG: AAA family ATPase [Desulfobacula sp.]|uniref:AAA family ATPase n=1 Tax=Desulfobacula sp. TaxID=2593537 RepID=UPI001DB97AAA|nr:AAA family ATPase [Desulfobacula sp.]MBT3485845.1 AAA family ATPase [Desulfobacula sp.]MBT3804021.1 AAA family ATPase [Desulfobacula sp.]MBT4023636.1 AAA family ATPase [Desulfobacula sp.]MBT4197696.1 AAA family ATPase [Desulfobacula sp.]
MGQRFEVLIKDLTKKCPSGLFDFEDTSELEPLDSIIGQKRAVEAINFGLNMKGSEYNIFVTGLEGTGKSTIIKKLLLEHAQNQATPEDLCLVNNFEDSYCPVVVEMPAGSAVYFSQSMIQVIEVLKTQIFKFFGTTSFKEDQAIINKEYLNRKKELFQGLEDFAQTKGLLIVKIENDYQVVPVSDGQPMPKEEYLALDEALQKEIDTKALPVEERLNEFLLETNKLGDEMKAILKKLVASKTEQLISEQIDPVRYYFRDCKGIQTYLKKVKEDIIDNIAMFLGVKGPEDNEDKKILEMTGFFVKKYQVNVLVDRRREKGAPVVFEPNPSFQNLFGKIEKKPVMGEFATDFTMVQSGSLLKANKGYLVLNIESLLMNPRVWESLKRTLQDSMLRIEDMPDQADYGMPSLKPAPIPLKVKVILVGGYEPFRLLQSADSRFNKIFKVRADFDYEARLTEDNVYNYARFIAQVCKKEDLLNFSADGVWEVIEYGNRMVSDRQKLSLRFGQILGILKEADYWAKKDNALVISREYVIRAHSQHRFRNNLYEEKIMEQFEDFSVLLDVKGRVTGQVNALAVYDMGEISFGRPTRITAESYMGTPGIINVEHESDLSGQTHDKGVMIVAGFLGRMFAQSYPLSVSISITFEQSYDGIDGDSASSTELYAVLSSLSGIPVRQEIAVTGSVNQKGEIQAIGGVNEKIEGFYDICVKRGLTKTQGVMIPASNVKNLVLRKDVVKAIGKKQFHIYKVSTIEEGIEVLTGVTAGQPDSSCSYPENTVFGKVQEKLKKYHELSMQYGK